MTKFGDIDGIYIYIWDIYVYIHIYMNKWGHDP